MLVWIMLHETADGLTKLVNEKRQDRRKVVSERLKNLFEMKKLLLSNRQIKNTNGVHSDPFCTWTSEECYSRGRAFIE